MAANLTQGPWRDPIKYVRVIFSTILFGPYLLSR